MVIIVFFNELLREPGDHEVVVHSRKALKFHWSGWIELLDGALQTTSAYTWRRESKSEKFAVSTVLQDFKLTVFSRPLFSLTCVPTRFHHGIRVVTKVSLIFERYWSLFSFLTMSVILHYGSITYWTWFGKSGVVMIFWITNSYILDTFSHYMPIYNLKFPDYRFPLLLSNTKNYLIRSFSHSLTLTDHISGTEIDHASTDGGPGLASI